MFWDQAPADVRLAEGPQDLAAMVAGAATVVVFDVLSYSTCVSIVVAGGSAVLPLLWRDDRAAAAAAVDGAVLAGTRSLTEPSLSPASLTALPPGTVLGLPSPNGAAATLAAAGHAEVLVGSLRNATATAAAVTALPVLLVAAGERWPDERLRPALEDRLGAGLVAAHLAGRGLSLSVEASAAAQTATSLDLGVAVGDCASGRELRSRGFGIDVDLSVAVDADTTAAVLAGGRLVARPR